MHPSGSPAAVVAAVQVSLVAAAGHGPAVERLRVRKFGRVRGCCLCLTASPPLAGLWAAWLLLQIAEGHLEPTVSGLGGKGGELWCGQDDTFDLPCGRMARSLPLRRHSERCCCSSLPASCQRTQKREWGGGWGKEVVWTRERERESGHGCGGGQQPPAVR
jgi:hypothetical protein